MVKAKKKFGLLLFQRIVSIFSIEVDLIEEVARIFGYNNIPNVSPKATLAMREQKEANYP